jgi:DNA repair exonuclease SbcCD ATPase subunit
MPPLSATLIDRPLVSQALAGAVGRDPLLPARDVTRELEELLARPPRQRSKLWEFGSNLHCSVIGTCLSTAELRQVFLKLGRREVIGATEHDIHASAVLVAGKHQDGAKLLHKALDRRHRIAISQFDKAKTAAEVQKLWREASDRGDIPGAYWAALTHPATNEALVREIFAEVHMLSHLVGAANRADIRRLRQLEEEKAELETRLARKDEQLLETSASRDEAVRALQVRVEPPPLVAPPARPDDETAELKARLARCETRRERVEADLTEMRAALSGAQDARHAAEQREAALHEELDALEARLSAEPSDEPPPRLGLTLLYIGGRRPASAIYGHWPRKPVQPSSITMAGSRSAAVYCQASSAAPKWCCSRWIASATQRCSR